MFWLCYEAKVHCLSRRASYALLVNGFNRQVISLVFPDYEAVSVSDFLYTSEHIFYFTSKQKTPIQNSALQGYNIHLDKKIMQEMGLEPTRSCDHRHLKPARLPIPPLLHFIYSIAFCDCLIMITYL